MREQTINLLILCGGLVLFSVLVVFVGFKANMVRESFAYLTGIGSGFGAALFALMRMHPPKDEVPPHE